MDQRGVCEVQRWQHLQIEDHCQALQRRIARRTQSTSIQLTTNISSLANSSVYCGPVSAAPRGLARRSPSPRGWTDWLELRRGAGGEGGGVSGRK